MCNLFFSTTSRLDRQKTFKLAAVRAKQAGDMEQARDYFRCVKQLEPLIAASESGLPVDLSTVRFHPSGDIS